MRKDRGSSAEQCRDWWGNMKTAPCKPNHRLINREENPTSHTVKLTLLGKGTNHGLAPVNASTIRSTSPSSLKCRPEGSLVS